MVGCLVPIALSSAAPELSAFIGGRTPWSSFFTRQRVPLRADAVGGSPNAVLERPSVGVGSAARKHTMSTTSRLRGVMATLLFGAWLKLRNVVSGTRMGKPLRLALRRVRLLQLPRLAREEMVLARESLKAQSSAVPKPFRKALGQAAGKFEDVPTFLLEVSLLGAGAAGGFDQPLVGVRRLAEALSLLFAAGRFHQLHREGGGSMQLLGGDFLYAEGQWILACLGCLPVIKLSAQTIRNFSDSTAVDLTNGAPATVDIKGRLLSAAYRTGAFFAAAAAGSAWLSGASQETVLTLYQYGRDLGCALELVRSVSARPGSDSAVLLAAASQLVAGARETARYLESQGPKDAARGLRRLARAVEAETTLTAAAFLKDDADRESAAKSARLIIGDFRAQLDEVVARLHPAGPPTRPVPLALSTLGLDRTMGADEALRNLIAAGLDGAAPTRVPVWPEGGPKVALGKALACVNEERAEVSHRLDGGSLSAKALSRTVREEAAAMLRSGGKRLRPALTLIVAKALGANSEAMERVISLGTAIEVLHSASLVHDDILDAADSRRGAPTLHKRCGELPAVFTGDYLFAVSSVLIAELGNVETIALISKVIADFGRGELAQSATKFKVEKYSLTDYLAKSFHKTASLLAAACQSAAVLGGGLDVGAASAEACYRYGMYVGLAFQVVDDVLDFTETDETLGKPALADLEAGYYSAPVLLSLRSQELSAEELRELRAVLDRKLKKAGDLDRTLALIDKAHGVQQSMQLARKFAELAVEELKLLPETQARTSLETFADFVVARSF